MARPFLIANRMQLRLAFTVLGSAWPRRDLHRIASGRDDRPTCAALTEAVVHGIAVASLVPASMDAEDYQPNRRTCRLRRAPAWWCASARHDCGSIACWRRPASPSCDARRFRLCRCLFRHRRAGASRHERGSGRRSLTAAATRIIGSTPRTRRSSPARSSRLSCASTQPVPPATRPTVLHFSHGSTPS